MSALNAALCRSGIILWLAVLLASRSTHSAPVYDQDTTQITEYDGAAAGCYFNFQRYQEGDRIITSEPCLNCTCHNRMLMCYLKVCPFTKAIGQDCTVEKRPDQCCPVITCPEVPVQLLTSTTSAPSISDSMEVGFHDNYGCVVDNRFYADGAQLPLDHHNPCELCYCIRNRTTCVMQECTLRVAGCKPVYQPGVCCPIKYNCEYDEELSTTVGPTPGLIMTTTLPPGVLPQCYHKGEVYEDGDLIYSTQPCQHCYCFRGEIACAVQNCGTPMQAHGKNCTALPPPEGECCPTTYECEEDGQGGIITLPQDEEQLPEQLPHDVQITESPIVIDEEQQVKKEHLPQEESFPGADNAIPHREGEEEEGVEGTIEHIIPSTEKPEEESATLSIDATAVPEKESTIAEGEVISPHEHATETSIVEETPEAITAELPAETAGTEVPTIVQETEGLGSEEPVTGLPEVSSTSESVSLQPEEETKTTEAISEENISTERNVIEKEYSTVATAEEEKPTEPSVKNEMQTEEATRRPEEDITTHEELPSQIPEEVTKVEKATEEEQVSVTEIPEISEISTEIEEVTPVIVGAEQPGITAIPASVTELTKEGEDKVHPVETTSSETLATETESPLQEATTTVAAHEVPSTEQIATEKEEISHPTEATITEQAQSTEVSDLSKESPVTEQKPVAGESEKEQGSEEPTSEHTTTEKEHVTVGAKKEDAGSVESPEMSERPITEEQYTEKSTPEIPPQGPTGIPIPERVPVHKAEDEYHVTEDYHAITRPEVIPGNLVTELPQKTPTTYFPPQDQETTLAPLEETTKQIVEESTEVPIKETAKPIVEESTEVPIKETAKPIVEESTEVPIKETAKPIVEESTEVPIKETVKPIVEESTEVPIKETAKPIVEESTEVPAEKTAKPTPEEVTEINLPSQKESSATEITTSSVGIKTESTSAGPEATTEISVTTITHEEHVPEEEIEGTEKPSAPKETETEVPQKEVQPTEAPSTEELPMKGLTFEESGESSSEEISGESDEKEAHPKKEESSEEEAEGQPPVTAETETVPEIPTSIPAKHEHSTVPSGETEQPTEGEQVTAAMPSTEQSTHITQVEEEGTETIPVEKERPVTTKEPAKEHITEEPTMTSAVTGEGEIELQTEEPVSKQEQTTETMKEIEKEPTTQAPSVEEEKTEPPEQYSPEIPPEIAVTESHDLQETETPKIEKKPEDTKGVSTEGIEQQTETTITEKEPSEESTGMGQTEITSIEQTELSVTAAYPTEKVQEEDEGKVSIPESTSEAQTEISVIETESTKAPAVQKETEKVQTESSISEEHLPTQPSITDRKEDQESIEQIPTEKEQEGEEQITHKPSLKEEEVTETLEEQRPVVSSEAEGTQVPPLEGDVTEFILPEEKPIEEASITESAGAGEIVTQPAAEEQPETASEQPEEVITELPGQEEQTQGPAIEEQPELHMRKETELPGTVTQESYVTPTSIIPEKSTAEEESVGLSESTETATSESTTKSVLIHETSTELPGLIEEHTEQESEVPVEKEIVTEFVPTEAGQQETQENVSVQPSITEEQPSKELGEVENIPVEVSTEEAVILGTSEVPEEQPHKSKDEDVDKETMAKIPVHEQYSTIAPEKTTEIKISTEIPPKETPEYSTEYSTTIPEEIPIEVESTSEIAPRPSGIPGEGNCLVEGQSYNNNSAVPPANACQTSCRCVSSIIQCELVQCPAPPAHLSNCMPVRTSGDSCCPMYACDSTPTIELESDSHMIESHTPETEEGQKTVPPSETSTEEAVTEFSETAKESSTIASEVSVTELQPIEVTVSSVSQMEEEVGLTATEEKQQTTPKSVEPIYEQPIEQSIGQQPEEHTISSVPETSEESASQVPEEEKEYTEPQVPLEETTKGKVSEEEEDLIKSTEQPQEGIAEEQTPVSEEKQQVITSTYVPAEEESHGAEEEGSTLPHKEEEITVPTVTEQEKISIPVETEASISAEKEEEVTTIETGKEEGITVPTKEQEKPIEEEGIREQSTLKPIEGTENEQPGEEEIQPISEETVSVTTEEYGTSIKPEEVAVKTEKQPAKSEVSEGEKTIESTESTSIPEIQVTTEHIPEEEIKHEEEKEQETITSTESEQVAQTEEPKTQTKLPAIAPGELETQEPIAPTELTTLIHDHTVTEEALLEEHVTVKSVETSTEERKEEAEIEISTESPAIVEEHVTTPILPTEAETSGSGAIEQELEKVGGEIAKPTEESISEVSYEETTPESVVPMETITVVPTETITEKETTEHVEEHTELSSTEHEDLSITKLPEEKPFESVSPEISTQQPAKTEIEETTEGEISYGKVTEAGIIHESEIPEVSTEEHPEVTPKIESHTTELSIEEHTTAKEIPTTSVSIEEETSEQPITPIIKGTSESSLGEMETKHPLPEEGTEAPVIEEKEHVTVSIEKQTPEPEKHPVEEQTVASSTPSEGETPESGVPVTETTLGSITKQEQQVTEKAVESIKPETGLPGITEEHTIISEVEKEIGEEEQKPAAGTTEETGKEEPVTETGKEEAVTEMGKESTTEEETAKEQTVTHASTTEEHTISEEEHAEQETIIPSEVEAGVKVQTPMDFETTVLPKEEEQGQVTSEASLPEYPVSEESTTVVSVIPEEYPTASVETGEKEGAREPEYQTTISTLEEEISKPASEAVEVEKLPSEGESVTAETETESAVTKVSVEASTVEEPEEVPSETEKSIAEQETESPKEQQSETTTKAIEDMVTEEKLPEKIIPQIPEIEEKSTETPSAAGEEEATTSIHEEEHPPIVKLQPTEGLIPSEEETRAPEEIHPSQPEEGEKIYPSVTEESQSTEQASEVPTAVEPEEHPKTEQTSEAISPAEEYPTKVSGMPTELPEEKITLETVSSEEPESEIPTRPEEGPQSTETSVEDYVTKIQPVATELPTTEVTEEVPEEGGEIVHPHIDHFPEATVKPETDYSAEGELTLGFDEEHLRPVNHTTETTERPYQPSFPERPATTLAPHIPEYPDQAVSGEDNPHFPMQGGSYLNPDEDYDEDDQAIYGPGTCRYGGKVYVSAQQIPRDDPCDFCFCFRSDIICLQQSCPPPIPGCHEEPISGFCCPRYECPVSMTTALNLTTTTTTTTTTLPPHFPAHAYKGAARRSGCQIRGQTYRVGEVIKSASGPCLQCTCGGDGNMKCDPRMCTPEPMLRQMIAAATAKRRR